MAAGAISYLILKSSCLSADPAGSTRVQCERSVGGWCVGCRQFSIQKMCTSSDKKRFSRFAELVQIAAAKFPLLISFHNFPALFRYPPPYSQIIPYNPAPTAILEVRRRRRPQTRGKHSFSRAYSSKLGPLPQLSCMTAEPVHKTCSSPDLNLKY